MCFKEVTLGTLWGTVCRQEWKHTAWIESRYFSRPGERGDLNKYRNSRNGENRLFLEMFLESYL